MEVSFNLYLTFIIMIAVLLLGRLLINHIKVLRKYDIPEPVVGGILVAILIFILTVNFDFKITFDTSMRDPLMLAFFSTIGLNADLSMLKRAGKAFTLFLIATIGLLIMQNIVGIGAMIVTGNNPLIGLIGGSVSLTGGFGTGAAWGAVFAEEPYNFGAATTVAFACATFGLVASGLMGGPMAHFLIKRYKLKTPESAGNLQKTNENEKDAETVPENINYYGGPISKIKLITGDSLIESLLLIALCLLLGEMISDLMGSQSTFTLPTFVWCLFIGVFLRNFLGATKIYRVFDREMDALGSVSLSLFLAFSLMNINLLELVHLAGPIIIVLMSQVILMFFYGWFVTFKMCGKNYDSAVLVAGQLGFAIGSTYNAIANMQTITKNQGPSPSAFIIVPMVGAFFIDIINALIINLFAMLPVF